MKRSFARLSLAAVLALLVALCLLALAGPALAGSPPLWGAHQFNSRTASYVDLPNGSTTAQVVSHDPWASGNLLLWFDGDSYGRWSL
jgi:hypothetical protein